MATADAGAQIVFNPIQFQQPESSVIGPDGTFYALVPGATSTFQSPTSELIATSPTGTGTKWTANLNTRVAQVLPGATTVFVVETSYSGTGRSATSTTTIALLATATGAASATTITPTGNVTDIEERTIGGVDYLYVVTISTSTPSPAAEISSTTTTTRTLTIYSATGTVLNTATL